MRQFNNEILPIAESGISKEAIIFDMGCGSGSLLKVLQKRGYQNCTGMDISPEQVKQAADFGVKNVVLGNAINYVKSEQEACDLLLGMDIIEHFTKDELVELLLHIRKFLRPGGRAIFRTPNLDAPLATAFANGDFTHENYLNASSAAQVMLACGFSEVKVLPSYMNTYHPVKEILRKFFWTVVKLRCKVALFATARSSKNILLTPNMLIVVQK